MSDMRCDISLTVNGEAVHETVDARQTLVDFLREQLVLTGSHIGCEHGVCGACTVRVNGIIVRGCLMLAAQCEGAKVETIEGVSDSGEIADLQEAFEKRNALQCGFCTPGHAADRAGVARRRPRSEPRKNPRAHFRQLLPLHRLSRHRRRHRGGGEGARGRTDMKIVDDSPPVLTALDRPNSYIGRSVPRPNMSRLMQGRAQYVSDVVLPRMAHVAFVRSPHAHAKIRSINSDAAKKAPGVIAVVTGAELAKVITPWVGVLTHLKGIKSAPQHAIAVDRACWAGEAVCAVVARTRAEAEDGCELVEVDYEELPAVTDPETALDPKTPVIHPELGDNLTFERVHVAGDPDKGFAEADEVVETTFVFGRHTGVCNEARSIVADWNTGEQRMTVYQGTQAPHMMQNLFAKHLDLQEHQIRVVTKDVGGSFGIKVHTYADEMATVALSKLLKRPIKFVADRIESFVTDIHARDHRVKAKIGVKKDGTITAWEIDDLTGIGPYSVYPRTSGIEANQVVNLTGGPYTCGNYKARARVVFQNKNVMCQYRAVGHPIATAVTEGLVEMAAQKIGMDPLEIRRRNLIADDAHPSQGPSGIKFEALSHHEALAHLDAMMNYAGLRAEQEKLRKQGIYRGIGFASFVEVTNPSAAFYGVGGARISAQDGATVRLDATGAIFCHTGVSEQGQGAEAVIAQCVASSFGVPMDKVRVIMGDTDNTPYGGGTWASRAAGIGGEAAWQAGKALRQNVLAVAGSILQAKPETMDIRNGDRGRQGHRQGAHRPRRGGAHRLLPAGHAAVRRPGRAGGDAALRAARLGVLVHQRHPGELSRGRHRLRLRQAAEALVRRGLRHGHQSAAGRRAGARRRGAGHRRGAVRALPVRRARATAQRQHGRLSRADGGGDAGHRGGPRGHADRGFRARRQGRGRSRHRRRAGLGHECDQRRAAAARGQAADRHAVHAGQDSEGAGQGLAEMRRCHSGRAEGANPEFRAKQQTVPVSPLDSGLAASRRTGVTRLLFPADC